MKIKLLLFVLCISAFAKAQNVNIPDTNWKSWLVNNTSVNTNGDSEIQVSEAAAFNGTLQPIGQNISDLTGLEAFVNLDRIDLDFNPLTTVDVSQNAALRFLIIADTFTMTDIILPNNTAALQVLSLNGNLLSSLDISMYPNVYFLSISDNQLTSLDMRNGNFANIGPNDFDATDNPNLTCIAVDDVAYANSQWTNIDSQTSFATSCQAPCVVNIPDTNFKAALVGNTAINTNGDTEIQCSEATVYTGVITLFGAGVSDLTGLEAFTSLTELQVVEDNINAIDLTNLVALQTLVLDEINISTLDISQNTSLFDLRLIDLPNLLSLDLSQNTMINQMQLSQLPITTLDVAQNTQLNIVNFDQLQVTSLDFSNNPLSNIVGVSNNALLENLDMRNGNNTALASSPNFTLNPNLNCIDVDDVAYANANWTNIDPGTTFSLDCSVPSNNPPVASCQNITAQLDATGNVTITASDIDDGSIDTDGTITLSLDQTSFDCSDIGENTVTLTVTDDDGATDTCIATVTVEDTIAPMLTVPSNITVPNDAGSCSAFVNLTIMNSDPCGLDAANTSNDIPAGFIFPVGVTTVTATATDVNGNSVTDTFTVTVNDTEAPVINTPSNITVSNDAGVCGADVAFTVSGTDNCGTPTVMSDIASGSTFPVGTTTVTLTADDGNGNTTTDTFTVTVNDTEFPVVTCLSNLTVTVNQGEQYEVPNYLVIGGSSFTDNCGGTLIQTPTIGSMLDEGTYTVSLDGTDNSGNNTVCSFVLTVDQVLTLEDVTQSDFRMYPNPATTQITVEGTVAIKEVVIYNLIGQEVARTSEQTLNIEQLPNAIYMVRIADINDRTTFKRFIKK